MWILKMFMLIAPSNRELGYVRQPYIELQFQNGRCRIVCQHVNSSKAWKFYIWESHEKWDFLGIDFFYDLDCSVTVGITFFNLYLRYSSSNHLWLVYGLIWKCWDCISEEIVPNPGDCIPEETVFSELMRTLGAFPKIKLTTRNLTRVYNILNLSQRKALRYN